MRFSSGGGATLDALRRDAAQYVEHAGLGEWYTNLGFWIGATYRLGAWASSLRSTGLRVPIVAAHRAMNILVRALFRVHISPGARIGPGLCLVHPYNIRIPVTDIGENCIMFQDVTLGTNPLPPGFPTIGDDVEIYPGARVLGGIVVGDGARIGANCVVDRSVPRGCVVVMAANRVVPASIAAAFGPRRPPQPDRDRLPQ